MKKKQIAAICIIIITLFTGCASNQTVALYNNNERIASDNNSFNLSDIEQKIEEGQFSASIGKLEGMETIWSYLSDEDKEINVTYGINVYSGKLKMVLITPDGEINILAECETEMEEPIQSTLNVQKGNNRIKLVADKNTKFDIDVSISEGEFSELGF